MGNAFEKGVKLMEALAWSDRPKGVTELAKELSLTKSNVHRLLRSLMSSGYAHQDPTSELYEPTIRFWELGFGVISRLQVRSFAATHMEELAKVTKEQVNLAILDDHEIVYIAKVGSVQAVFAPIGVGNRSPVCRVALGKAMLAFQPAAFVARVLKEAAEKNIGAVDADAFQRELGRIRSTGYAVNRGEWRVGVAGLAAPILSSPARCIAAIGISGPLERLRPKEMQKHAPHVIAAAQRISAALGYSARQ